jgi:phage shock protein C
MTVKKELRRSDDKYIAGVCAGLAEYSGLNTTFVRILFVVFTLIYGLGIIIYLICLIVLSLQVNKNNEIRRSEQDNKIDISDTCPHCKSPNTKKLSVCEWCGNEIY